MVMVSKVDGSFVLSPSDLTTSSGAVSTTPGPTYLRILASIVLPYVRTCDSMCTVRNHPEYT
jgi:hypothetical protein